MSKIKDKWAAIWVRANRTHSLPLPPGPSGDSIIVVVLIRRILMQEESHEGDF
jgi:hypothetical protein